MFALVSIRFVDSRAWEFQLCNKEQFCGLAVPAFLRFIQFRGWHCGSAFTAL